MMQSRFTRGAAARADVIVLLAGVVVVATVAALSGCATMGGGSPTGSEETPSAAEQQAMADIGAKAQGVIVWSSSRIGNHDLFVMNTDGSHVHPITKGE